MTKLARPRRLTCLTPLLGALAMCCACSALVPSDDSPEEVPATIQPTIFSTPPPAVSSPAAPATIASAIELTAPAATFTSTPHPVTIMPTPAGALIPTLPTPTTTFMPSTEKLPPCLTGLVWERAELVAVIDGDTIDVRLNDGRRERVRYIGVNAPERDEPGHTQATQVNASLLSNPLFIARDISDRDRFGRLLRYVVSMGKSLSHELIARGWAQTLTIPPDVRCANDLVAVQREAQSYGHGLWASVSAPTPLPTIAVAGGCDPAYPEVCIPSPPPDLDCSDIPHRRFRVRPPDPHRFDSDNNGIGCER